jgi:L-lactate dehydrogenase complex protein LldG
MTGRHHGGAEPKGDQRELVLGRIRSALRGAGPAEPAPRAYGRGAEGAVGPAAAGELAPDVEREALVSLMCERLLAYKAEVRRIVAGDVGAALLEICEARGARRLVVPPGLPSSWRPAGLEFLEDDGLSPAALDALDGVVTGCTLGVADTGTLVLAAGPTEGRRALTLVPDLHICVVAEEQVVPDVPTAIAALVPLVRDGRQLVLVSGPSATSDIELTRVEGVHGPRQMVVLVTR